MGAERVSLGVVELRNILCESIKRNKADTLLFSAGVDTSILAYIARPKCFTVGLEGSPDIISSEIFASLYDLEHYERITTPSETLETLPKVIKMLKTFDLALPNDVAIYLALRCAKEHGIRNVMTGDGADELFAGYEYMKRMEDLDSYINWLSKRMRFSSVKIAEKLDMEVKQPYLDEELVEFALDLDVCLKVRNGYGKWILRKAFEPFIPEEIIWRMKTPIEYGSGTSILRSAISSMIRDDEFEEKRSRYNIGFMNHEHLYYYEIFRRFGKIYPPKSGEIACECCGAGIPAGSFYCPTCGFSSKK